MNAKNLSNTNTKTLTAEQTKIAKSAKTILVTGFEPFGNQSLNPSMLLLERLPQLIGSTRIETLLLPVTFEGAPIKLLGKVNQLNPDAVICLGQAAGRKDITLEKVAINYIRATIPDNDGRQPGGEKGCAVVEGGADGLFSTLPLNELLDALHEKELPASLSLSAGSYVCNTIMYTILNDSLARHGRKAGFIHVPLMDEQAVGECENMPSLSLETMEKALHVILETMSGILHNDVKETSSASLSMGSEIA